VVHRGDLQRREWTVLAAAAILPTLWTQEPLTRMDAVRYFTDWFPYYIGSSRCPFALPAPSTGRSGAGVC
jgi:hypothetical protein